MADDWTTVDEGAPTMVSFDTIGDVFIARYWKAETVTDPNPNPKTGEYDTWTQYLFHATAETLTETGEFTEGELLGITGTWAIDRAMKNVPEGSLTRIEYVKDVDTNKGNPMKSFKVQYKK